VAVFVLTVHLTRETGDHRIQATKEGVNGAPRASSSHGPPNAKRPVGAIHSRTASNAHQAIPAAGPSQRPYRPENSKETVTPNHQDALITISRVSQEVPYANGAPREKQAGRNRKYAQCALQGRGARLIPKRPPQHAIP
jgi:hypothetical protein